MAAYRTSISLIIGIVLFFAFLLGNPFGLDAFACKVLAIGALMITWWISEALPMPVVSLMPLILFPLMGVCSIEDAAKPYASPIMYLFLGGFLLGLGIEKWNLHKRMALNIVKMTGTSGNRIILGFIIATSFLSMWLSNTATTMMMFPMAMSIIKVMEVTHKDTDGNVKNLGICLMMAIAYASNLGGLGTIIGTPPNVAYVAFLQKHNHYNFDFVQWMIIFTPLSVLLVAALYFVMIKMYPNKIAADTAAKEMIRDELRQLGKLNTGEKRVLVVFVLTATLWIVKDIINEMQTAVKLDDTIIAVMGAVLLFIVPSGSEDPEHTHLLSWHDTEKMAWGILLLFGGGITLAAQMEKAGLIQSMGHWIAGFSVGGFLMVFMVAILSIFISEVMSNVAQVIVFAPVVAGIAEAIHMDGLQLGLAMTLGASCASMMPMGTPPNAIVFASGKLKLKDMAYTGFIMNIISAVIISVFCWYVVPLVATPLK